MSLLLEALKKAELAKQSAEPGPAETKAGAEPVITRDTLPDISQALDIRANDLPSAGSRPGETPFGPAPVDVSEQSTPPRSESAATQAFETGYARAASPAAGAADSIDGQRAAARHMFEAKEADLPHPRRNFYMTLGALGLFATGYGGYVWWQMQPRSLYNTAAIAQAGAEAPPPAAAEAPMQPPAQVAAGPLPSTTADAPAASPSNSPASAPDQAQTSGGSTARTASRSIAPPTASAAATRTPDPATVTRAPRPATPRAAAAPRSPDQREAAAPLAVTPPTLMTNPQVERAYAAFQQGDLPEARNQYQIALQRDPANRDALLGLAAIDVRARNYELAESRYLRLLETDPRDAYAAAGLIALRGHTDPVQSESRLKSLIAMQPDVAHLHLALGNQYAAQSRWPEAQSSYFKAFSLDPENADFAFNLAVSLDQLKQGKLALEYYRRAIALAGTRPISFEKGQVSARIGELAR